MCCRISVNRAHFPSTADGRFPRIRVAELGSARHRDRGAGRRRREGAGLPQLRHQVQHSARLPGPDRMVSRRADAQRSEVGATRKRCLFQHLGPRVDREGRIRQARAVRPQDDLTAAQPGTSDPALSRRHRTYPTTVEDEVNAALARPEDFLHGPIAITRDTPENPDDFAVVDGNYVSARWPGDAHRFARTLAGLRVHTGSRVAIVVILHQDDAVTLPEHRRCRSYLSAKKALAPARAALSFSPPSG